VTPRVLSVITLLLGAVALGLVVIPAIAYDQPFPWQRKDRQRGAEVAPTTRKGGLTVTIKGVDLTIGGKRTPVEQPKPAEPEPVNPTKPFTLAAAGLAVGGMVTGALSWRHRRGRPLALVGMALGVAALTWQYIAFGLAVGAAIAIILIILSALSS